jgi:hypothetical protein
VKDQLEVDENIHINYHFPNDDKYHPISMLKMELLKAALQVQF